MSNKRFVENQLGLYFAVGPAGEASEDLCAQRHAQSYDLLDKLFNTRGMDLFGIADRTVSEDFRYLPMELCEVEWDGQDLDGKAVYSVWVHSTVPFDADTARKVRELAQQAYSEGCGTEATFIRAELSTKWEESERKAFDL